QADLRQNGVNMVGAATLSSPQAVAVDHDGHLYVADTSNHRVLGWASATAFQNGDPATIVLGQPNPQQSNQYAIGTKGFSFPFSVSAGPVTGHLYLAHVRHRPRPRLPQAVPHPARGGPGAGYGQPGFGPPSGHSRRGTEHTMNGPRGVSVDAQGN